MSKDPEIEARLQEMMAQLNNESQPLKSESKAIPSPFQSKTSRGFRFSLTDWRSRFSLPFEILLIPWTQQIINESFFHGRWSLAGEPRSVAGIPSIFLAAFSHAGWGHLVANTIAFLIFSWLILSKSKRDFWITVLTGWLGGGFACWLLSPQSGHGLSGVVYTLFGYLLIIGWLEKRFFPLLISVFVMVNFNYCIWGIFPTDPRIAWWAHLLGFLLGIFSAYGVYREPNQNA